MLQSGSRVRIADVSKMPGNAGGRFDDLYGGWHEVIEANEFMVLIELEEDGAQVWLRANEVEETDGIN